jgi:hypothetical protein
MESALSHLFVGDNLVHLAAAIYLAGFLFRDQIMLRPPDRGRCREHRLLRVFIGEVSLPPDPAGIGDGGGRPEARYVVWDAGALRRLLIRARHSASPSTPR